MHPAIRDLDDDKLATYWNFQETLRRAGVSMGSWYPTHADILRLFAVALASGSSLTSTGEWKDFITALQEFVFAAAYAKTELGNSSSRAAALEVLRAIVDENRDLLADTIARPRFDGLAESLWIAFVTRSVS